MVITIAFLSLVSSLIGVCVEDLQTRSFHAGWLIPIFLCAAILGDVLLGLQALAPIGIALLISWVVLSVRQGGLVNFFRDYFGVGDLLLLAAICPLFISGRQLLFALVLGCLIGLLIALFGLNKKGVPFAVPLVLATAINFLMKYFLIEGSVFGTFLA